MKTKTKRIIALIGAILAATAIVLFAILGTKKTYAAESISPYGEWVWNEELKTPTEQINELLHFTTILNGEQKECTRIIISFTSTMISMSYELENNEGTLVIYSQYLDEESKMENPWMQPTGKTINFNYAPDVGSTIFMDYLNANATKQDYETGYENGYNEGYQEGFNSGKEIGHNNGYEEGYQAGIQAENKEAYEQGKQDGYNQGYTIGKDAGLAEQLGNPITAFIQPAEEFLNMKIFGAISIGDIINVMLFIAIGLIFLKIFAGG